jgi:predicted small lipoprotein YifL
MKKIMKTLGAVLAISMVLAALPGCAKKEGPAEQAGKAVDNAVDKAGAQVEKAGENIQDTARGDKE